MDKLPKYARPKKPWIRGPLDYGILDKVGSSKQHKPANATEGNGKLSKQKSSQDINTTIVPKAAAAPLNPYEALRVGDAPPWFYRSSRAPPVPSVPPSFSAAISELSPSFSGVAPPSFSSAIKNKPKEQKPPSVPKVPKAPQQAAKPPPIPPVPSAEAEPGGPPKVPPPAPAGPPVPPPAPQ